MEIITGRRPICALISIICSSLAILSVIIGIIFIFIVSAATSNWAFLIFGLAIIAYGAPVAEGAGVILCVASFLRKEYRKNTVISAILCAPVAVFGIVFLIAALISL